MIYKSYIVEQNINLIRENLVTFYGENLGLKNYFKKLIKESYKKSEFLLLNQEEVLKDQYLLFNELNNISLFGDHKVIFIDNVNDKILELVKDIQLNNDRKIFLFANLLDKKSKLRNHFEKTADCSIIPCYTDNENTIRKIIQSKLHNFRGLTLENINLIIDNCNLDRVKLDNEIDKIILFFQDNKITTVELKKLLNVKVNDEFDLIRDEAILGNRAKTNILLGETEFENEKNVYYLNSINQRLQKLKDINYASERSSLSEALNRIKPPIFWKDKPIIENQVKKWNRKKIKTILEKTYNLEINLKSNSLIDKNILLKKLIIDICNEANSL